MNPDFRSAVVAWLLADSAIVSAFGSTAAMPKIWGDWAGPTSTGTSPIEPYAVTIVPQDHESYETGTNQGGVDIPPDTSSVIEGMLVIAVFAEGRVAADALAVQVGDALQDAPLEWNNGGLMYLRRTSHTYPIITAIGPDGAPISTPSYAQMKFFYEKLS
jgi:hypothetical protein